MAKNKDEGATGGPKLVKATVARGRTIRIGKKLKGEGEEVELSAADVERFRKTGHLLDPNKRTVVSGRGPQFFRESDAAKGAREPGRVG